MVGQDMGKSPYIGKEPCYENETGLNIESHPRNEGKKEVV